MDKTNDEANLADPLLKLFPRSGDAPLPMPRFGKVSLRSQQAQSLASEGDVAPALSLSWLDEDDLGIRVFVREESGPKGIEVRAYAEGMRPELLGKPVSVALAADKGMGSKRLTILLDKPGDVTCSCRGTGYFGTAADLRKHLGEKVILDVFLFE